MFIELNNTHVTWTGEYLHFTTETLSFDLYNRKNNPSMLLHTHAFKIARRLRASCLQWEKASPAPWNNKHAYIR